MVALALFFSTFIIFPVVQVTIISSLQRSLNCDHADPTDNTTIRPLCLPYGVRTFWNSKHIALYLTPWPFSFLLLPLPLCLLLACS